ncbi:NAD-glutamate dehydrogenase [Thermobifida cellulosilytica]|uniref:NAD-glutamate dehydrogenase n=1 Tax=Thermobifida cellulosilytica TB100 TaxID=665004 RepID=A0A147KDY3_THECS|nr:NAD-glutamate dehydrogenase [Thermobifida cellulosilytica]KUP95511.1 NAD-glutamate dehydrogenase [Thermobifida cellulosilytica TB100]
MSGQPDAVKTQLLDDAVFQWPQSEPLPMDPDRFGRFLRLYYWHVDSEELKEWHPAQIVRHALAHWELGAQRTQGRAKVRVRDPEDGEAAGQSIVEIVTDNAPFLVSSVTSRLAERGISVRLIIHPQLRVERDTMGGIVEIEPDDYTLRPLDESWIHLRIDRLAGEAARKELADDLDAVLTDVRLVDEDHARMRHTALRLADQVTASAAALVSGGVTDEEIAESAEFLRWLTDQHFIFMGYREYRLDTDETGAEGLRAVLGTGLGLLRMDSPSAQTVRPLPPEARSRAREPHVLVLTKANSRSTVHQPKHLDYIGVKKFDEHGRVVGEHRFLGLYTREAETRAVSQVPILARKQEEVLRRSGFAPDSYDGREAVDLLAGFPREELLQMSVEEIQEIVLGVLRLRERRGTRLFLRRDPYGRYMSCLVYMPRDRYTTKVRLAVQDVLARAFRGATMDHSVMVGSSPLARLHIVVRANRGDSLAGVDRAELEAEVARVTRSWNDDFAAELAARFGPERARELLDRHLASISESYKVDVPAAVAVDDVDRIDRLGPDDIAVQLYRPGGTLPGEWRCKVYRTGSPISLSRVLPLLEHMGLEIVDEWPYSFEREEDDGRRREWAWIYDFGLVDPPLDGDAMHQVKDLFEEAFVALWQGRVESDRFNALVVHGGLDWRQVTVLRAYAKYLRQTATTFTPAYIADVLTSHAHIARLLVRLFESRFDPRLDEARAERCEGITEEIRGELDQVDNLDSDRILRFFLAAIEATLRTNYFQDGGTKPYLVYKLDPGRIPDLPQPRPKLEMFVYSPRVEGVHLRFGTVARGGLRWSDRLEDFRTEVLGLVKAQTVKNSVIVPSGAKGGFVCKQLPKGDRDAVMAEVVACYKQFISGLLDVTDNLVNGHVSHPEDVVRYDGDDSYLVVAADKGTATFSDIANSVAAERGFWLGDAFASGGSVGYDHKAMGITARGAWESIKYHFREMGVDVQNEDFTAVGIGDMSGDVFGNGMLRSEHIRLVAAFDHRHIFLDPDPDPAVSYAERRRLFELPRSSWEDYDPSLISEGGGVYPRTAKSVPITPQVREALGIADGVTTLTPQELIRCVLTAPVDLLWNGGIGTYVKASTETHAEVGDKSNDPVRVDASQLRCKVVGEGGNLGMTQAARIEFALAGGRVNTDFIDNSAGVDTSDHEVNIKIMLDREVRAGRLDKAERDELFVGMTDEVARLVLRTNYQQNTVLAAARKQSASMLHVHTRYMRKLERDGYLTRGMECLPDDKAIAARRSAGQGLTGPEFATLISYTKIALAEQILASDLPDDPYLRSVLVEYFPTPLRERFGDAIAQHPLRREIVTTMVVNDMVNRCGSTFAFRFNEETGADAPEIARAYLLVTEVFGLRDFWAEVEALDYRVDVDTQLKMLLEARKLIERSARWLMRYRSFGSDLNAEIVRFREGVREIVPQLPEMLQGRDLESFNERRDLLTARGVPRELAVRVADMVPAYSTFDLVRVSEETGRSLREVAEVYFDLADQLQLSRLRERVVALPRDDRWSTMARGAVRDDLYAAQADLSAIILRSGHTGEGPDELRAHWTEKNRAAVRRATELLSEIWETERFDLPTLSVAVRSIRSLVDSSN